MTDQTMSRPTRFPRMATVNYAAYNRKITRSEIRQFLKTFQARKLVRTERIVYVIMASALLAIAGIASVVGFLDPSTVAEYWIFTSLWGLMSIVVFIAAYRMIFRYKISRRIWEFANDNNWGYTLQAEQIEADGFAFSLGHSRRLTDVIAATVQGVPIEVGSMRYKVGCGRSQCSNMWTYVAVRLPRKLPHILLDARLNEGELFGQPVSDLSDVFHKSQTLSLEGDFNKHFTLYAAKGNEQDALYILSPNVMAFLIDTCTDYDIEFIGDTVYLYTRDSYVPSALNMQGTAADVMDRLLATAVALEENVRHQATGYSGNAADKRLQ